MSEGVHSAATADVEIGKCERMRGTLPAGDSGGIARRSGRRGHCRSWRRSVLGAGDGMVGIRWTLHAAFHPINVGGWRSTPSPSMRT